ncbi:ATP-binding protein [Chloroflexota bacterium]
MEQEASHNFTINIRPAVSVYATYRRLSYRPWYAIAEFVDNSTQSYYDNLAFLLPVYVIEGMPGKLRIKVMYDSDDNILTIDDNAYGMESSELERALCIDRPPPNTNGRCEFGMGLKTAACWFGPTWTIETSQLGSPKAYKTTVHVPDLVDKLFEDIPVEEKETSIESHYTRITIKDLYKQVRGPTAARIRSQLSSMYRQDLRSGDIEIFWNGQPIQFQEPPILKEDLGDGTSQHWKKDIKIEVPWDDGGTSLIANGWIGIRIPASQRDAGFALMRRGRVIMGGPGDGYKPFEVFGQGNTFRSQRLIGELNMDSWPVTQAKDAFDWSGGLEDVFIEELKTACQEYMDKAEGHRQTDRPITPAEMEIASDRTKQIFEDSAFSEAIVQEIMIPEPEISIEQEAVNVEKIRSVSEGPIIYRLDLGTSVWQFRLHWQDQLSDAHWMQINYPQDDIIDIFLNMSHPFFYPHMGEKGILEVIQKFVISMALAERMTRQISGNGQISPSDFRNYMNRVLRYSSEIEAHDGV